MAFLPEHVRAIVDTREQTPFDLSPLMCKSSGLATGDYSVDGMEDQVCLERKELGDLIACCGPERERFIRELQRMKAYQHRMVIVEAAWAQIVTGSYRSQLDPKAAVHSIISFQAHYAVPFLFAGTRDMAQEAAKYFLYTCAKHQWIRSEPFRKVIDATRSK